MQQTRRNFIKNTAFGAAGLMAGQYFLKSNAYGLQTNVLSDSSTVKFVTGTNRREMVLESLMPFADEVSAAIQGKNIIIKPNFVVDNNPLAATHVDSVRGVLDFLETITDQNIIVGENSVSATMPCYSAYNYLALENEYNVSLVDLDSHSKTPKENMMTTDGGTHSISIIDDFFDPNNYFISVCRIKTHNCAIATLTNKNLLLGAPAQDGRSVFQSERVKMHGKRAGTPDTSEALMNNMFLLSQEFMPQLAVLDGVESMQGNGPVGGTPVNHGVALAGTDSIAVDRVAIKLMGIDPEYLKYLKWMSMAGLGNYDYDKISVDGPNVEDHIIQYQMANVFNQIIGGMDNWTAPDITVSAKHPVHDRHHLPTIRGGTGSSRSPALIRINLPMANETRVNIYNTQGRKIRELFSQRLAAGRYSIAWDGRDDYGSFASSGTYLLHLQTGNKQVADKVTIY